MISGAEWVNERIDLIYDFIVEKITADNYDERMNFT
jgi:hypothetical protein